MALVVILAKYEYHVLGHLSLANYVSEIQCSRLANLAQGQ